jgi:hypothetical protein
LKKPAAKEGNRNVVATGNRAVAETDRNRDLKTVARKISRVRDLNRVAGRSSKVVVTDLSRDLKIVVRKINKDQDRSRADNKTVRSKGLRKTAALNSNDLLNKGAGRNRGLIKSLQLKVVKINN